MTTPVFPALAGQSWSVHKKPMMSTIVASHVSGREVRHQNYQNPVWEFELTFDGLDSTASGAWGSLGAASLQNLMGFFLSLGGQAGTFIYYDPTDYSVSSQSFGAGDGSTTSFQLVRALGGQFSEAILAPVTTAATLSFPGGATVSATAPVISVGSAVASSSTYSISNGVVTFASAPASGAALTWSGCFGFLCRFSDDNVDFEQFMWANLWRVDSIKFRSVRSL